jgi:hypothetical protein
MKLSFGIFLGLTALLGSCSQAHKEPAARMVQADVLMSAPPPPVNSPDANAEEGATAEVSAATPPGSTTAALPRLLIYHADLRLKVADVPRASTSLDSLVHRNGGYLSAATEVREEGEWRQAMTIRVAPSRFQPLMAALCGLGTVEEKKLTTDDVTAQHADVAARLTTKRAVEKRYIDLLARARKISEILEIEGKIGEVREEIESTESRLKALNDEVAYSTISLVCYQPIAQPVHDAPVVSFASRLVDSFYGGWTLLTSLLIGLVSIWPVLILGAAVWLGVRRWRRKLA